MLPSGVPFGKGDMKYGGGVPCVGGEREGCLETDTVLSILPYPVRGHERPSPGPVSSHLLSHLTLTTLKVDKGSLFPDAESEVQGGA